MVNLTISEQDNYIVVLLMDHSLKSFQVICPKSCIFKKKTILWLSWSHLSVGTHCLSDQVTMIVIPPYSHTSSNMGQTNGFVQLFWGVVTLSWDYLFFLKLATALEFASALNCLTVNMRKNFMFTVMHRRMRLILSADALSGTEKFIERHDDYFHVFTLLRS